MLSRPAGRAPWLLLIGALVVFLGLAPLPWAGLLVAGVAAFLLTIVRAEYGLYWLLLAVPFGSLQTLPVGSLEVSGVEVVVALTAVGWVLRSAIDREARLRLPPLSVPAAAFVLVLAVSAWQAPDLPVESERGVGASLKEVVKWAEFLLVYLMAANILRTRGKALAVLGVLLVAGTLAALIGWYQFLLRVGPEGFIVGGRFLRAYGTFGQPNPFAGYLGMTLSMTLGAAVGWLAAGEPLRRWYWVPAGFWLVMLMAVAMSLSRGAWLGLAVTLALVLSISHRRGPLLLAGVGLLVVAVGVAGAFDLLPSQLVERAGGLTDSFQLFDARTVEPTPANWAVVERMANWQAAWTMFGDFPWLGVGIGRFADVYPGYALPYWRYYPAVHAHNYYLTLLAETGLVGLLAYLAVMGTAVVLVVGSWWRSRPGEAVLPTGLSQASWSLSTGSPASGAAALAGGSSTGAPFGRRLRYGVALGVLGVLVYLAIHSLFDDLYVHGMTTQVALFLGLLGGLGSAAEETKGLSGNV